MAIHLRSANPSTTGTDDALSVVDALPRQRMDTGPTRPSTSAPDHPENRWVAHRITARVLQLAILSVPVAASLVCAIVLSDTLPRATDLGAALLWWAVVVVGSTVVLFAVDRVARKMLPLAVLLRLSLLFPDQAPKRFRVAIRAWNSRRLRERVEAARTAGRHDEPTQVATSIIALLANLAAHDRRTRGHCERVRAFNDLLAEEMGLPQADRDRLRWAALIHDIGKLAVPPRLLNKPGRPTAREWDVLRAHPLRGAQIAAPLATWLGPWAKAIEEHHERWDGTGYPHGLAGEEISLGARIVAVADAFEVMTSARPYSRPVTADRARAELATCAGQHFDPAVVRAFLNISIGALRKVMGPVAFFAQVPVLAGMPRLEALIVGGSRQAVTGAGAAAGVVAVTSLAPHATAAASHHHPVATAARSHVDPAQAPAAYTVPATPAARAGHAATSHPKAAAPARHTDAARHPRAVTSTTRTHQTRTASITPTAQTPAGGVQQSAPSVGGTGTDLHGRCLGNSGNGWGNGGPRDADHHARAGHRRDGNEPPGLAACGDGDSDGNADGD